MIAKSRINPWIVVWLCFATLSIVLSARQSVAIMTGEWVRDLERIPIMFERSPLCERSSCILLR